MKARYIIYLASILTLCSCSEKNPDRDIDRGGTEQTDEEIRFSPEFRPLTKVHNIVDSVEDMQSQDMSLYGWTFVYGRAEPTFAINNLPLIYNRVTPGEWDYTPHQYWIPSVDSYGFGAIWPYKITRNDPVWTPSEDPARDSFRADDVVRNDIVDIQPRNAYLTTSPIQDLLVGYKIVEPANFGKPVEFPMEHAMSAFRIRVRNLTGSPLVLNNWYLTGLKTHIDMVALIIGRNAQGEASQVYTRIPDKMFVGEEMIHAPVGQTNVEPYDFIKLHIDENGNYDSSKTSDYIKCEDPANTPNNYKYLVISQRLQENDPLGGTDRTGELKNTYAAKGYTNYSKHLYWGRADDKGMNNDHYFMPFVYEKGATMFDYNGDGIRDNKESNLQVRVFECRSHFYQPSGSTDYKSNGGIYMPVSTEDEAYLYSPYFFSAENHEEGNMEDWNESLGPIESRNPSHRNESDGSYSIFRWDADHTNPYAPTDLTAAIENYKAKNSTYPESVANGDLVDALNDDGYVLAFPQDVSNLEMSFSTASLNGTTPESMEDVVCNTPVERKVVFRQAMDIPEWKPGYKYDYLVTITSESITITLDLEPWHDKDIIL